MARAQRAPRRCSGDPNWSVVNVGDFNGDAKADLVWKNSATGASALWLMNGTAFASGQQLLGDPAWSVTQVADFDDDGRSDLIWRNSATGATAMWLMSGATLASGRVLLSDPDWTLTHTGDFNADGRADLVWRNGATGRDGDLVDERDDDGFRRRRPHRSQLGGDARRRSRR
jgi:hypothetical protein